MHVGVCLQQNHGMAKDSRADTNSNCTGSQNRATRPVKEKSEERKNTLEKARKRELLQDKIEDLKSEVVMSEELNLRVENITFLPFPRHSKRLK